VLVLGRKPGESIRVGEEVVITIVSIAPGQVRIGIEAPSRVTVHREEVYDQIASANRQAALDAAPEDLAQLAAMQEKLND
jgi:carbon storage regulator